MGGRHLPSYDSDALEQRRFRAIEMLRAGKRQVDVAWELRVTRAAVSTWWKRYRASGDAALARKPRRGRPPKLPGRALARLPALLERGAGAYGYTTDLWTTKRVAELIHEKFGVRYDRDHVCRILHKLGLSWQRPVRRALERDEKAIRDWVRYRWPAIKKKPVA